MNQYTITVTYINHALEIGEVTEVIYATTFAKACRKIEKLDCKRSGQMAEGYKLVKFLAI